MPPALHRLLGNIDLAADELAGLIEDLLEIARLQSGRVDLWRSQVDLKLIVTRAIRALEPLFQARSQRVSVVAPEQPVIAPVDAERMSRVLRNLLSNAQKYGRDKGNIVVRLEHDADEACIFVEDDGPGIPPEEQERIFERFYRVGRSATTGSGLGLAIARGLVELHGGQLSVESSPGKGSIFRVTLPAR